MLSFTKMIKLFYFFDQSQGELVLKSQLHHSFKIIEMGTRGVPTNANIKIDQR
jgi:hypothetical protein